MATVKNLKVSAEPGLYRNFYATWDWDKKHTENYQVQWQYKTLANVWFEGTTNTVTLKNAQYTAPDNADWVRCRVKPISKKHSVNGAETEYWIGSWTAWVKQWITYPIIPAVPDVPEVSISNYVLTAQLDVYDSNTSSILFELVENDTSVINTGIANVILNHASINFNIVAGKRYKVRAMARNESNTSEFSNYSSNVYSTPEKIPGPITAMALTETSVRLNWARVTENISGYNIEYTTNKDYFDQSSEVQSVSIGATQPYAIITGLQSGSEYFFRIASVNADGAQSPWSEIISCVLGTVPTAPTTWESTSTAQIGEEVTLYWIHNSQDGSRERVARIEIHKKDNEATFYTIPKDENDENTTSSFVFDTTGIEDGYNVRWQVRTQGILPQYSPNSIQRSFRVFAPVVVYLGVYKKKNWWWDPFNFNTDNIYDAYGDLSDPYTGDIVITSYPIFIQATVEPVTQTPLEAHFTIYALDTYQTIDYVGEPMWVNEGDVIFQRTMLYNDTNKFVLILYPNDLFLENGMRYKLVCEVAMDSGLRGKAELEFQIDIAQKEYEPNAEISYDETNVATYIRPYCEDENEETVSGMIMSVYRINFDGEFIELAKNIRNNGLTTVVDPHPNLKITRYRIVGFSVTDGGVSYVDLPGYPIPERAIVIQWNEQWRSFHVENPDEFAQPVASGSMLKLPYNIDISDNANQDVSLVSYIGRRYPVSYYGTHIDQESTWSVDIPYDDDETLYQLRRLSKWMGDCYVREPNGSGYWAQISISYTITHCEVIIPIQITVKRVEGGI